MWDYLLFLLGLISVFKPSIIDILNLSKIDAILSGVLIFVLIILLIKTKFKLNLYSFRYVGTVLLFWGVCMLSTILYGHNVRGIFVLTLKTFFLGLLCVYARSNDTREDRLIISSMLFFGSTFIINILLTFVMPDGSFTEPTKNMSGEWVYTYLLGSKNNFTTFALMSILFIILYESKKNHKFYWISCITIVFSIYGMQRVYCSTGVVIFTLLLLFYLLRIYKVIIDKKKLALFITVIVGSSVCFLSGIISSISVDFLQEITHRRFLIWVEAIKYFIKRPLLGYGMQLDHDLIWLYGSYRYSHSEFLELLLYGGIIGLIILVVTIVKLYKEGKNVLGKREYTIMVTFGVFYFLAQMYEAQFMKLYIFYFIFYFAMRIDREKMKLQS